MHFALFNFKIIFIIFYCLLKKMSSSSSLLDLTEQSELGELAGLGSANKLTPSQLIRYNMLTRKQSGQRVPSTRMQRLLHVEPHYHPSGYLDDLSYSAAKTFREKLKSGAYNKKQPGWELLRAIGPKNLGVSFNPYLTTEETAKRWLEKKKADDKKYGTNEYGGWGIEVEDLDSDPRTPDDVVIVDSKGNPKIVSGYRLNTGKGRRRAAIFYNQFPDKRLAAVTRKELKAHQQTRLLNKWLAEQSQNANSIIPYSQEWMEEAISKHPKLDPRYYRDDTNKHPYQLLRTIVFSTLKQHNKSTEPMFFYIAQDTLSAVYEKLKETHNNDKNAIRNDILTNRQNLERFILSEYNELAPMIRQYHLQNVAPLWGGFPDDDKLMKSEGTVPTGFPTGSELFSGQENK
jgi:hypothetical protein